MAECRPAALGSVVMTGGSRGLGLGIAKKLVATGYRVIAVARTQNKEMNIAMIEAERCGRGTLDFVPFDFGNIEKIPDLVRGLRKQFGHLFGLVNNAALGHDGALAMAPNSRIEELMRVNTLAPIMLTKYVVRATRRAISPVRF